MRSLAVCCALLLSCLCAYAIGSSEGVPFAERTGEDPSYDANGDGVPDLLNARMDATGIGHLDVVSGADGSALFSVSGQEAYDLFGYATASAGPLHQQLGEVLIVTAPRAGGSTLYRGRAYLFGSAGELLNTLVGPASIRTGFDASWIPDQDGDGIAEVIVQAIEPGPLNEPYWRTLVHSGSSGDLLIVRDGPISATLSHIGRGGLAFSPFDIDRDGDVDISDVMMVVQHVGPAANLTRADVDRNGTIDALDCHAVASALGQNTTDLVQLSVRMNGGDEIPSNYNELFPSDPLFGESTGGTGSCVSPGIGTNPSVCTVAIVNCPVELRPDDTYTFEASGYPAGGTYSWVVSAAGGVPVTPASWIGPSTFPVTILNAPAGPMEVTVQVTYTVGDCTACAECTFSIPDPCEDVSVSFAECPGAVAVLMPGEMVATGRPAGGTYTWVIEEGQGLITPLAGSGSGPVFGFIAGNTPGLVRVRVDYTVYGCTKSAYCEFGVDPDVNGNGVPDPQDCDLTEEDSDGDGFTNLCELRLGTDKCQELNYPDYRLDRDGDGVPDVVEASIKIGPDWRKYDTDGDGVPDGAEMELGLDPLSPRSDGTLIDGMRPEWLLADKDRDVMYDEQERRMGLDPADADMDRDGFTDGLEVLNGMAPTQPQWQPNNNGGADSDGDGLSDALEALLGTDPYFYDTDGDGLPDGLEVRLGMNPLSDDSDGDGILDADEDFDGDGLSNFDELVYGTDPAKPDTDGDGVPDGIEVAQGSDPKDPGEKSPIHPDELAIVAVTVGDDSGSHSERWALEIGTISVRAPGYGQTITRHIKLRRGKTYQIKLVHLGSKMSPPDYDYSAWVSVPSGAILDDPSPLLGIFNNDDTWPSKRATLYLPHVDIDIDTDNNNGLALPDGSEAEEEHEDTGSVAHPAKLTFLSFGDADGDGIPDFADGLDIPGLPDGEDAGDLQLVPIRLKVGGFPDPEGVIVLFQYYASEPTQTEAGEDPVSGLPFVPAGGGLRLWTSENVADQPVAGRSRTAVQDGGSFVQPGVGYTLSQLGASPGGDITLWLEAVRPSEQFGDQQIVVTVPGSGSDAIRVTSIGSRFVRPQLGGGWQAIGGPLASQPSPTVSLSTGMVTNPRLHPTDPSRILVDVQISGTIADPISDSIAPAGAGTGVIQTLGLRFNGADLNLVDPNGQVTTVSSLQLAPGQISKATAPDPNNLERPFPFQGTFVTVLQGLEVRPGFNRLEMYARNPYGLTGFIAGSFVLNAAAPPGSNHWEHEDYTGYQLEIPNQNIVSGAFASQPGEYNPFFAEILGPPDLSSVIDRVLLGNREYGLLSQNGGTFAAGLDASTPYIRPFSSVVVTNFSGLGPPGEDDPAEPRNGAVSFGAGFGAGLFDTGAGVVDGVWMLIEGTWYLVENYNVLSVGYRLADSGNLLTPEDERRMTVAWETIEELAPVFQDIVSGQVEIIEAVFSGDEEKLAALGADAMFVAECTIEVLEQIRDEISSLDDFEKGRLVGRIVGETTLVVATAGWGTATKAGVITQVCQRLQQSKVVAALPPTVKAGVLQRFVSTEAIAATLVTTKTCFLAGTPVWTTTGAVPIESVQRGDMVLATDPDSGEQGYHRVVETITTVPSALFRLEYFHAGSHQQLIGTGEHPFYVQERKEFVALAQLATGSSLLCANGELATVLGVELVPLSDSVQTYNLEVESLHTYHVGAAGVLVHNSGPACQRLFALWKWMRVRIGDDIEAFRKIEQLINKPNSQVQHSPKLMGELVMEIMKERHPNVPSEIWTPGRVKDSAVSLYQEHWHKHVKGMPLDLGAASPIHMDNALLYVDTAYTISLEAATGTVPPTPNAGGWYVGWRGNSTTNKWDKLFYNDTTKEFVIKVVGVGPDQGKFRTYHRRLFANDPLMEFIGDVNVWTKPAGASE